ncbi:hypothetical protein [Legionella maioricensis]|uniref:Uncharacterized protein n=1 Tax=Legionella maioricensis TaxID=2896528 RepID=A0A9X2IDM0_9GAMM|nr:hypothetical protein [Legionella maioricensis]MCL9684923.1 hypothetical protein [Legionella maioricensis]MCL9688245.1 hypothetical protein [Legionella maioricensis]
MHRCRTLIISGLLYSFLNTGLYAQLPSNYQDLAAEEKRDLLWSEITQSHEEEPLPPFSGNSFKEVLQKLKGLFNLKPTFDYSSDELPEGRMKIIHANGSVGKIAFIPAANHPFTGIYQTGGIGLARLSLATPPTNENYIPGMAIKILISKNPSLNLQVMNLLEGQKENWNYFAKDFSNQIPHPTSWTLKAIEKIFEWTRAPANDLPLWHLAVWTSEGKYNGIPIFPERIYFRSSNLVKDLIPENSREDFRTSFLQVPFGPIYEVYGEYQGAEYHIGTLMLESYLLASHYGDKNLFFQHQR